MNETKICYICTYCRHIKINGREEREKFCICQEVIKKISKISNIEAESCQYYKILTENIDDSYIKKSMQMIKQENEKKQKIYTSEKYSDSIAISDIRREIYNGTRYKPIKKSLNKIKVNIDSNEHHCDMCIFFRFIPYQFGTIRWCFSSEINHQIISVEDGHNCLQFKRQLLPVDINIKRQSKVNRKKRREKIIKMALTFRYNFRIIDEIAYLDSRYEHWLLLLSDDKEHLYHKNSEYIPTALGKKDDFHIQKIFKNEPLVIFKVFEYIEDHDKYVLRERILRKIIEE